MRLLLRNCRDTNAAYQLLGERRDQSHSSPNRSATIVGQMAVCDIREHKIGDAATVFFFARVYSDDLGSAAAYDRAKAKIGARDNTSLFRVKTPDDGRNLLFVLSGTLASAKRVQERVAWGGDEYIPTAEEITAIGSRLRESAEAHALTSTVSWSGVGGLGLGTEGSRGPLRRPRG